MMTQITIPLSTKTTEYDLQPSNDIIEGLKTSFPSIQEEIKTLLRRNLVSIGEPTIMDITARVAMNESDLPNGKEKFDYKLLTLFCSFRPDTNCRFSWGRLSVTLTQSRPQNLNRAICVDLYPKEILTPIKTTRKITIGPSVSISPIEIKGGELYKESEYMAYQPLILGFGNRTSLFSWDFKPTDSLELPYNVDGLMAVIRLPRKQTCRATLSISAEIEAFMKRWIRIPLIVKHKERAATIEFQV